MGNLYSHFSSPLGYGMVSIQVFSGISPPPGSKHAVCAIVMIPGSLDGIGVSNDPFPDLVTGQFQRRASHGELALELFQFFIE